MDKISQPVPAPGRHRTEMTVGSTSGELTQSLRRLQRAIWSEKMTQSMKIGKPVGQTPLIKELEKHETQLGNIMRAYGLKEEEMGGETNGDMEVSGSGA